MKDKRFLYSLIFLLSFLHGYGQIVNDTSSVIKHHNKIDDVQDAKQVEYLLKSIDKKYADFKVNDLKWQEKNYKGLCDSLQVKPFVKADFDHNGYTDLLVIGEDPYLATYCIMDSGKNKFSIRIISRQFEDCLPVVSKNGNETFINNYTYNYNDRGEIDTPKIITSVKLLYKLGGFIEYHDSSKYHNIEKIEFSTTMCFGTCPVFSLAIDSNRTANYDAIKFNKPNGKFKGMIKQASYKELIDLLNYIDFPLLKDDYRVGVTDQQTGYLKITYDGGKTKQLSDYGLQGTYGLRRLYEIMFSLRRNQVWK